MSKFCIYCGATLKPDAKFCVICGKPVAAAAAGAAPASEAKPMSEAKPTPEAQPTPAPQPVQTPPQAAPMEAPSPAQPVQPPPAVQVRTKRGINPLLIAGILFGAVILTVVLFYAVKRTVPQKEIKAAPSVSIDWSELPVTQEEIPQFAAAFLPPETVKLVSYGEIEYGIGAQAASLTIHDCRFQSTEECRLDFSEISATLNFRRVGSDVPWEKDSIQFSGSGAYKSTTGYTLTDPSGNQITVWPAAGGGRISADENGDLHFSLFMIYDEHFDDPYFTLDMTYYPDGGYLTGVDGIHTNGPGYCIWLDENFVPIDCDTPFMTVG